MLANTLSSRLSACTERYNGKHTSGAPANLMALLVLFRLRDRDGNIKFDVRRARMVRASVVSQFGINCCSDTEGFDVRFCLSHALDDLNQGLGNEALQINRAWPPTALYFRLAYPAQSERRRASCLIRAWLDERRPCLSAF